MAIAPSAEVSGGVQNLSGGAAPGVGQTEAAGGYRPLTRSNLGADDGIRTRDPHLGKVMLYQLSHVRVSQYPTAPGPQLPVDPKPPAPRSDAGSSSTSASVAGGTGRMPT